MKRIVEFEPGMEMVGLPDRHRQHKAPRERYHPVPPMRDGSDPDPATAGEGLTPETHEADESQEQPWQPSNQPREGGLLLVFDGDQPPPDDLPVFWTDHPDFTRSRE